MDTTTTTPKALGRNDLNTLGTQRQRRKVIINENGDYAWIQEPTAGDRDWAEKQELVVKKGQSSVRLGANRAKLLAVCLINEDGSKMFKRDEWEVISSWAASLQELLYSECCDIAGITEDAKEGFLKDFKKTLGEDS